jgi:quinol monooxygenase YgiN
MFQIIWEFRVAADQREAFEIFYGPEGEWAKLFRRSPHYQGTALLRDPAVPGRYLTVDSWNDGESFKAFKESVAGEYKAIDARCEALTEYEMKLGGFETL